MPNTGIVTLDDVDVNLVEFNDWNPNSVPPHTMQKIADSIREYGFVDPATGVWRADGRLLIIDGEHRVTVAKQLGYPTVPVVILGDERDISPARQRALTLLLNELRGKHDPLRTAEVIEQIQNLALPDEPVVLPYSETAVIELMAGLSGSPFPDPYTTPYDVPDVQRRNPHEQAEPQERQAFERRPSPSREGWQTLTFTLPETAALVVRQALDACIDDGGGPDDFLALEQICADFIAGKVFNEDQEEPGDGDQ